MVVDGVDQLAEQQNGVAGGSQVAAGVRPKLAINSSHQLLKKVVERLRGDVCSIKGAREISVTVLNNVVKLHLQI